VSNRKEFLRNEFGICPCRGRLFDIYDYNRDINSISCRMHRLEQHMEILMFDVNNANKDEPHVKQMLESLGNIRNVLACLKTSLGFAKLLSEGMANQQMQCSAPKLLLDQMQQQLQTLEEDMGTFWLRFKCAEIDKKRESGTEKNVVAFQYDLTYPNLSQRLSHFGDKLTAFERDLYSVCNSISHIQSGSTEKVPTEEQGKAEGINWIQEVTSVNPEDQSVLENAEDDLKVKNYQNEEKATNKIYAKKSSDIKEVGSVKRKVKEVYKVMKTNFKGNIKRIENSKFSEKAKEMFEFYHLTK